MPATWQGWVVTILYIVFVVWAGRSMEMSSVSNPNINLFTIQVLLATVVLLGICFLTGEKPRWRWGDKT